MMRMTLIATCGLLAGTLRAAAQDESTPLTTDVESPESKLGSATLSGLKFRSIGPALMSGRIADLAVDPVQPNTWYVAVGSGGVFKTTNAGTTFEPIFDGEGSYSIGCVTIDPSRHDTLWVGTGEAVGGRHVGFGDGVYRSRDGGRSFENLGLKSSEHIAKILVHPRDSEVVYVASQGPLWSSGGERGLYKSTDGGASWRLVLSAGPYTGVTDVVMDPRDPDILIAATHQRHRTVAALLNGGPESGIHKSMDGGETWRELKRGLPEGDKGKIGLALSTQRPEVVYATIELPGRRQGGFWRSEDGGESWEKKSDFISGGTGPHYYQELWVDPHRFDTIYQANVVLGRTDDGGATWTGIGNSNKHVDNHAVAFHPTDPDFLLVGCDGGLYRSYDRGKTYAFSANLPLTQFYKVDVDYDWPIYHVVGGTQDNNTQYGPSQTMSENGIQNADWRITIGGDGHDCAIDPEDPDVIYCESQQGYLRRFDRRTGESVDIRPQPAPGEEELRFNWDSPIHISPHSHTRIYHGSKKLHRSDDRGESWTEVSPDLSRGMDRLKMEMMDRVWSIDATWDLFAMSQFGNITSISESPLVEGLIYVGTDDGLIQVTEDGGSSWRPAEAIADVPEFAFVNDVKADLFDADVAYAALDHHKQGDYRPFLVKSVDRGITWTSMAGDLPERHLVWRVIQDHVRPELFFAGTEFGIFMTLDGGQRWHKLKGGLPTISFRDLEIQRREDDLVGASFGRSFFVLDDYSPLRELSEELLSTEEFVLFPVRPALRYVPDDRLGGRAGSQGDSHYAADNPPFGAVFTCYLRDSLETLEKVRQKREKERKEKREDNPYPGWDVLQEEARESTPRILLEIRSADGSVANRIEGPTAAGIHRLSWDLTFPPAARGGRGRGRGALVPPGSYRVQAYRQYRGSLEELGSSQTFEVRAVGTPALPASDPTSVLTFQRDAGQLLEVMGAAAELLEETRERVQESAELIRAGHPAEIALLEELRVLDLALRDASEALVGSDVRSSRGATDVPSPRDRARQAWSGTLGQTHGPTTTHRQQYAMARAEYAAQETHLRELIEVRWPELRARLEAAGVPWTTGRPLPPPPQER